MQAAKVEALLEEICQKIGGDWLLVGGGLVLLEYDGARATEDVDLVQVRVGDKSEHKAQDQLFQAAFRIGLDPESVNSAARFFLSEIEGWKDEIIEIRRGSVGAVFKPTLTLFVAMKLRRATEIDLRDVESAIKKEGAAAFDAKVFSRMASAAAMATFQKVRSRLGI